MLNVTSNVDLEVNWRAINAINFRALRAHILYYHFTINHHRLLSSCCPRCSHMTGPSVDGLLHIDVITSGSLTSRCLCVPLIAMQGGRCGTVALRILLVRGAGFLASLTHNICLTLFNGAAVER